MWAGRRWDVTSKEKFETMDKIVDERNRDWRDIPISIVQAHDYAKHLDDAF